MLSLLKKPFVLSQIVLLLGIGGVLLVGDQSEPRLTLATPTPKANQAIVVQFNRPVDRASFEKGFSLTAGANEVQGMFSWSSRTVAFIPNLPLAQGTGYALSVQGVVDGNGQVQRSQFSHTLNLPEAEFVYVTSDLELAKATRRGEKVLLTDPANEVLSYAVSEDGSFAVVSMRTAGKRYLLEKVYLASGERKLLSASSTAFYQRVALCSAEGTFVAFKKQVDEKQTITGTELVSAAVSQLDRLVKEEQVLIPAENLGVTDTLACSFRSRQLLYRTKDGSFKLGELGGDVTGGSLGNYLQGFGFSPDGSQVLLGNTSLTNAYPVIRNILSIDSKGQKLFLSNDAYDATDGAVSPTNLLAFSEDRRVVSETDFQSKLQVVVRARERGVIEQTVLDGDATGSSSERPRWSVDGRILSFERVSLDAVTGSEQAARPQDSDGRLMDGEICYQVLPDRLQALFQPLVSCTGLRGGSVTWLP